MNKKSIIIVVFLVILLIPAVKSTITHLKGEGACCGVPKESLLRKKLDELEG